MKRLLISNERYIDVIDAASKDMTEEERSRLAQEIFGRLLSDVKQAETHKGRDYITYTPHRKIYKTTALIDIAHQCEYPIIVHDSMWARHIEREAAKKGKKVTALSYHSIPSRLDGLPGFVILKDDMVDVVELRDILEQSGHGWLSIVGVN